jgi:glutamyl/glutaminyl-tRNA synthetase
LAKRCLPFLQEAKLVDKENVLVLNSIGLVQERMKKLSEVSELTEFFFKEPNYKIDLLITKKSSKEEIKKNLKESLKVLSDENDFTRDSLDQLLRALANKMKIDAGEILWPLRVALTGKQASPGTFEMLAVLGKEKSLVRIKKAIDMLQ